MHSEPARATPPRPNARDLLWRDGLGDGTELDEVDSEMAERGHERVRTLVQLQRELPLEDSAAGDAPRITTRSFDPDTDSAALVSMNNAAFDWHPEQGGWDLERLDAALAQPWVQLAGILLHESSGVSGTSAPAPMIDGFCWTRIHRGSDPEATAAGLPAIGEIWVIAAHPERHGRGLGRALVVAGLDHLTAVGMPAAMLYTEEDNVAAMGLYDRLGFRLRRRRGGYRPTRGSE